MEVDISSAEAGLISAGSTKCLGACVGHGVGANTHCKAAKAMQSKSEAFMLRSRGEATSAVWDFYVRAYKRRLDHADVSDSCSPRELVIKCLIWRSNTTMSFYAGDNRLH
jgi:hypothetical protein